MRKLLTILFLLFCFKGFSTNWYFSLAGNDGNAGTIGAPWLTTAKFNSINASKAANDSFLFRRGDTFLGNLIIGRNNINIGAYGSGANPVITGFTTVSAWTNLGANIWESTSAISTLPTAKVVSINGVNTPMGRFPNTGYLTYQSASTSTSITSSSLNAGATNWTGATAVIKKERFVIDRGLITSASGTTINYTTETIYPGLGGWGFFIQGDTRTLDVQNEWYYNPSTHKIRVFSSSTPVNVKVSSIDQVVRFVNHTFITFSNLTITGGNDAGFYIGSSANCSIQNCSVDFNYNGILGINFGGSSASFVCTNNTVNHSNNNGMDFPGEFTGATITGNVIQNSGLLPGMSQSVSGLGMNVSGINSLVQYNSVINSGYNGIGFNNNNINVLNNFIDGYCISKDDGGGIYTGNVHPGTIGYNIVLNGIGASEGTNTPGSTRDIGIYVDNFPSGGYTIIGNTVAHCAYSALMLHNSSNVIIRDNTLYDFHDYGMFLNNNDGSATMRNITMKNNINFGRTATQLTLKAAVTLAHQNDIPLFGTALTIDSNYYARPIDDNLSIVTTIYGPPPGGDFFKNLAMWKTYSGYDAHANKAPVTITNVNQLDFEYNATASPVVKTLPAGAWVDVRNTSYSGTTTLQPYTSLVLINIGAGNTSPTANAGPDQTIQLPVSSVNLVGSGNDPDGSISSYLWTKVSGTGSTITTPASASTSITGLSAGVYQFKLTVTDNQGATGSDIVIITVNPANVSPTANAGTDQAITLPTSTTTLAGSGNDPDGSITAYLWTKISGPAGGTITSPTSATTGITALQAGTYIFNLRVTDNQGATGNDQITVIVSASANIAPTANAGVDQTIQLPTNSVNLVGTGNDTDGSIVSYSWVKISGGAATITSPGTASTSVTGLVQGVYQFKLTVTDNGGLTGSDNILITVLAANLPPLANAGTDQTITAPTSTVTLSGSATDPDGSVSSHTWTKTSGTGGTITSPANYSTIVTGLTPGTYVFRLTATDNQALTGFDEMTVVVNPAGNVNPIANAGTDQVLTWPTNSINLSGSGTDADGVIVSYLWNKISGPASYGITGASTQTPSITGLDIGVYQFQLQVTDNSGGTGTDVVGITQNKGNVVISVSGTSKVYNGSPQGVDVSTSPSASTSTTYNGVTTQPTNAASYAFVTAGTDPHWNYNTVSGTFTITKASAVISASNQTFNFDGLPHTITATVSPNVPGLTYTYSSGSAPTAVGVYNDTIRLVNSNYTATQVIVTITIVSNPSTIFISDTSKIYNGSPQGVTVTSSDPYSVTYNGSATVPTLAGTYQVIATISSGPNTGQADTANLTIAKQQAILSWIQPAPMPFGALLSLLQLSASSNVSGTFTYSYPLGTQLQIGVTGVMATFTPTDTANYSGGTVFINITVFGVNPFLNYYITSNFFLEI